MTSIANRHSVQRALRLAAIATVFLFVCSAAFAAPSGKAYSTPEKAVDALMKALRANDQKALRSVLGKGSEDVTASGDPVRDKNESEAFIAHFDKKHTIKVDGASATLIIGENEWPFPIPVVKSAKGWQFDTPAGREEIINRRVGKNELSTIQTLFNLIDAEREYYAQDRDDDGLLEYALKFRSSLGRHDGLFWPTAEGETPSPLGLFVAEAAEEGYSNASNAYHGYHYRILTSQGPHAKGGSFDYMVRDNLVGGFAFVAWPAVYGDSGVMTFIVSYDGIVYQKDLGEKTEDEVAKIAKYDPDPTWTKVADSDLKPVE